ncbi:ZBED4 protein, partial [Semnornis frantzii]|nr:ZBED4 protein [Semnornis frantzii]
STLLPGYPLMSTTKRKREKAPGGLELGPCSVDRRKSKVWNFYRKLGDAYVECTICRKQLSFHNSTTTMREHLVRKHHIKDAFFSSSSSSSSSSSHLREDQAPECDLGPQESFKRGRQLPPENSFYHPLESRWEVVVELLVEMIFKDLQPLSVVKDKGFGVLLGFLEPGFQLPSPEKLREVLRGRYEVAKKELESYLRGAGEVAVLSLERWRCRRQSYVSTALNLIDGDWRRARCLLETRRVGEQGAWGAGQQLQAVLQEFGLSAEAVFCVVDGGAEDVRGGKEEEEEEAGACGWRRLPCAAGVLQRCV